MAASRPCRSGANLLTRSLAIGMVAVGAGAAHSWIEPVKVALKPRTDIPVNPVTPGDTPGDIVPRATIEPPPDPANPNSTGLEPVPTNLDPATLGQFINLAEARALFEAGTLFIDTRLRAEYDTSHILGAEHLSTVEFGTPAGGDVLAMLSPAMHYVLYCEGGDCDASENVAQRLEDSFPLYHIMRASFKDWEAAGYDVEKPQEGTP